MPDGLDRRTRMSFHAADHEPERPSNAGGRRPSSAAVEALIVQCLERVESGTGQMDDVLAELFAEHPDLADELRASVRTLVDSGLFAEDGTSAQGAFPERLGDFRLQRRLGRGGMGVVYLAEQCSLGRPVALKLVRLEELYFEGARMRFRREAEAIARLSHPGIVAIHAVGEERGIPYLAMEYVRGVSLDRIVQRLEHRAPRELTGADLRAVLGAELERTSEPLDVVWNEAFFRGPWDELCLRIVRQVAEALEHAHRRGVLHRDVKPSNIMLTPEGLVSLLDFGLAGLGGTDRVTRTGAMLGSLSYMAPELLEPSARRAGASTPSSAPSAETEARPFDPRVDVYGLGVTLYELLGLRAPFLDRASSERTRANILEGRPAPLRKLLPGLGHDAEVVCSTAMERDPARRYTSAAAFAGDLTHALERRPIAARPAGPFVQAARWARRRPGRAVALVFGLALVTLGPTTFALQSAWAKERISVQAVRAERNFDRAVRAVDLIAQVAIDDLGDVPMAQVGQRRLLEASRSFYAELVAEPGSERSVAIDRARALVQLGSLEVALGDAEAARVDLERAIVEFEELGVDPRDPAVGLELCRAYWHLASALSDTRATDTSQASLRRGIAALTGAVRPTTLQTHLLSQMRCDLGVSLRQQGDFSAARDEFTALIDAHHADVKAQMAAGADTGGSGPDYGGLVSRAISERAMLNTRLGFSEDGLRDLRESVAICEALQRDGHASRSVRQRLLNNRSNLGGMLLQGDALDEAEHELIEALAVAEALVKDYPGIPGYRFNLGGVLVNLGGLHISREDLDGGRVFLGRATDLMQALVDTHPENLDYLTNLVAASTNLSSLEISAGDHDAALARLDALEGPIADLAAARPGDVNTIQMRLISRLNRLKTLIGHGATAATLEFGATFAEGQDPDAAIEAASCLSRALAENAPFGPGTEATTETKALALRLVEHALQCGHTDARRLDQPSFDALRDEPRFQAALARY
jgi:serine/threonine protein kinase/tetratricopeptide (TPR) repeat protein